MSSWIREAVSVVSLKRIVKCVRQDGRIDDYGGFGFYARGMKISIRTMPASFSYLQIETDVLNTPSGKTPDLDLRTKTSFSVSIAQGNKIRSVDSKATRLFIVKYFSRIFWRAMPTSLTQMAIPSG